VSAIRETLRKFCKDHFNEIVFMGLCTPCRLVGFGEDKWDFYYLVKPLVPSVTDPKITWWSAVDWAVPVKERFDEREYASLEQRFKINNNIPEENFLDLKEDEDSE